MLTSDERRRLAREMWADVVSHSTPQAFAIQHVLDRLLREGRCSADLHAASHYLSGLPEFPHEVTAYLAATREQEA